MVSASIILYGTIPSPMAPTLATARWPIGGTRAISARSKSTTVQTAYGLGGAGGGRAWFDAPVRLECGESQFVANLWVSNTASEVLTNGSATITLPAGLRLAAGQSATQSLGNVVPSAVSNLQLEHRVYITAGG